MRPLFVSALAALAVVAPALASAMTLDLNETTKVRLSAPARDVVVANPEIVDVSLLGPSNIAIIGKGYGSADVLVTDEHGHTLFSQRVNVRSSEGAEVSYLRGPEGGSRGAEVRTYICGPTCMQVAPNGRR